MKYKKGDRVKVKKDLVVGDKYGGIDFAPSMGIYTEVTIDIINNESGYYFIKESGAYYWTDAMLDGLVVDNSDTDDNNEAEYYTANLSKKMTMQRTVNIYIDKVHQEPLLIDICEKCGYGYLIHNDRMIIYANDKLSFFEELLTGLEIEYVIKGDSTKVLDN